MEPRGPETDDLALDESEPVAPASSVLQTLFERAPEIITLTGPDGRQTFVNAAGLRLLGYPDSLRRPEDPMLFVHPDDQARLLKHRELMEEMAAAGGAVERLPAIRYRVRSATGDWRWLESEFTDLRDVPEVGGRVAFSRDVTEAEDRAQALRESEARLKAMVSSLRSGALVEDQSGRVVLVNQPLLDLFAVDKPVHEIIGHPSRDFRTLLGSALVDPLSIEEEPPTDTGADLDLTLRSGRMIEAQRIAIRDDEDRYGHLWLFFDATARRIEERRRQTLLQLERQAREAAEHEAEHLREYDQLRNDFVARVSHDLRTPLTAISAACELLLAGDDLHTKARDRVAIIQRNSDRLRTMIEELLLAGRLNAGMLDLELEPTRLAPLLDNIAELYGQAAVGRNASLLVEAPNDATVIADGRRLTTIIENLVDNAIKFTDPGTEVVVSARRAASKWIVAVRDHGPGIPSDQRDAVFERFTRSPEVDRSGMPGSGLGLTIVKGLVELHGGTVVVGEAAGGGALFEFALPAADTEEQK